VEPQYLDAKTLESKEAAQGIGEATAGQGYRDAMGQGDVGVGVSMNTRKRYRIYTCNDHNGHWMYGVSVIRATSEEHARELLDAALAERGLSSPYGYTLRELPKGPVAVVLFDGDD
jgi:hypothetical protein